MRGRLIRWVLPLVLLAAVAAGAAMAATGSSHAGVVTLRAAQSKSFGMILVSSTNKTLYRYTVDSKGVNRCSSVAACKKYWPALLIKAGTKPTVGAGTNAALIGTIKAAHGMSQVTYAGFPLYFFAGDKAAGQTNGQGFESKWYVVNAKGALVKHAIVAAPPKDTVPQTTTSAWG